MKINGFNVKSKNKTDFKLINMISIICLYATMMGVILLLSSFVLGLNTVVSGSMKDTLQVNTIYLRNKVAYSFTKEPKRGQIVDFYFPGTKDLYVKRIIGLPNEEVYMNEGKVYINNEPIEEDYIINNDNGEYGPYTVPKDCYFMLGDNRTESDDSRFWQEPFVKRKDIEGKVILSMNKKPFKISIQK